jgi:small-conductance mechanosensitive channel
MSDDVVDQLKKVQVSKLTLGLVGSIIAVSAVVTWNAAQVASRIDQLERSVADIEVVDTSDLVTSTQLLAAIQDIPEPEPIDLSGLATTDMVEALVAIEQAAYEDLSDDLEDLQDSVAALLLDADREPEWVDEIEEIQQRLEEMGWELGDLWWRTDMNEQACRTRLWCDKWYDENW